MTAFPWTGAGTEGMTLRDYFASHATEADVEAHSWKGFTEEYVHAAANGTKEIRSRHAAWTREQAKYLFADAMLKAREA